jgi:hypothetical protein
MQDQDRPPRQQPQQTTHLKTIDRDSILIKTFASETSRSITTESSGVEREEV